MMNKYILIIIVISFSLPRLANGQSPIIVCGSEKNDIVTILKENNFSYRLYKDPAEAIMAASAGSGILFLADGYPAQKLKLPQSIFPLAKRKRLRLYVEYPENLPEVYKKDTIIRAQLERGIVTTSRIKGLDSLDLLGIHSSTVIPEKVADPLIVLGKVAGFNKAVYGISDVKTFPLLYQRGNILVATTRLSNCITARFGPAGSWQKIWLYIIHWLDPGWDKAFAHWPLQVSPMYGKTENLPRDVVRTAVDKGSKWFYKARLLVDSSWEQLFLKRTGDGSNLVWPAVDPRIPIGDGSLGVMEGHVSRINPDGSQPYRWWNRADDQAGVAYALALSSKYLRNPGFLKTADHLLNYLYVTSNMRAGPRNDPKSPSYGLVGWSTTHPFVYYGDDNARVILGTIGASVSLHSDKWNDYIIEAIMGNFRTAGKYGFRGSALDDGPLQKMGWRYFADRDIINAHPHYESWLWACYLWLYNQTGYKPLLEKAETAIRITMDSFPDIKWTNSIQDERAHMILPLAWLVRVDDTREHRAWLKIVADMLLADLQSCGAIREELGKPENGKYRPPASNKAYGSSEAPLIFKNGNPAADLLYTENFAFFSLNEAAHATGDPVYRNAVNRMADFLVRIQVKSKQHPDLDGGWFRAFDYRQWEYWASNADAGWGAWCTQTGWIQSWILSTLVLIQQDNSFWDETKHIDLKGQAMPIIHEMLPKGS